MTSTAAAIFVLRNGAIFSADMVTLPFEIVSMTCGAEGSVLGPGPGNITAQDKVGETALMLAAAIGQDRIIEMLINAGADSKLRNKEDLNAFQIATNAGHQETARFIQDRSNFVFKLFN